MPLPVPAYAEPPLASVPAFTRLSRYHNCIAALDTIHRHNVSPLRLLEVGTSTGALAAKMLNYWRALSGSPQGVYYGFDFFTAPAKSRDKLPLRKMTGRTQVADLLKRIGTNVTVNLHDGEPSELLERVCRSAQSMHLILIGGDRNPTAITAVWKALTPVIAATTIVLFDNYYTEREDYGCKPLMRTLAAQRRTDDKRSYHVALLHPIEHEDNAGLKTRMVRVTGVPGIAVPDPCELES